MNVYRKYILQSHLLLGGVLVIFGVGMAQEKKEISTTLTEVPAKFEDWQDSKGFGWQLLKSGAVSSGATPYFQSALELSVNGKRFDAEIAKRFDGGTATESGAIVELRQTKNEDMEISRHVWFDAERSAIRFIDSITNIGKSLKSTKVVLKSSFQYPWQDLHGSEGQLLGAELDAGLNPNNFGVVVKFSQAEGRHDTLFVTSGEEGAIKPTLAFSSNSRELTFAYDLELKEGETASLLTWVAQRNLKSAEDAELSLMPLYHRRRLLQPDVPIELADTIVNFDSKSLPNKMVEPFDLNALVALNQFAKRKHFRRGNEDALLISDGNQIAGTINEEAQFTIEDSFGSRTTKVSSVAAIAGGGVGQSRVFLRNGDVWSGLLKTTNYTMTIDDKGRSDEIELNESSTIFCRIGKEDGRVAEGFFIETRDGNVVSLEKKWSESLDLKVVTPWGADAVSFGEIVRLLFTKNDNPQFRLEKSDGSRLTVFLPKEQIEIGSGKNIHSQDVIRIWKAGDSLSGIERESLSWLEFSDIDALSDLPSPACLLAGNNLVAAELKNKQINIVTDNAVTLVNLRDVIEIRRTLDSRSDGIPILEIEFKNGDLLSGAVRERMLAIESKGREWAVPVEYFLGYRQIESEGDAP